jgi:succinate dehydrogenase / fumarate reductase cytochrome b subunit
VPTPCEESGLTRIRFPVGAVCSIGHRVSGVALAVAIPFLMALFARSLAGAEGYAEAAGGLPSPARVMFAPASVLRNIRWRRHLLMDIGVAACSAPAHERMDRQSRASRRALAGERCCESRCERRTRLASPAAHRRVHAALPRRRPGAVRCGHPRFLRSVAKLDRRGRHAHRHRALRRRRAPPRLGRAARRRDGLRAPARAPGRVARAPRRSAGRGCGLDGLRPGCA